MRRVLLVLMIAAVGMLVAPILPAMADSQEEADSIVFFPYGNGGTYSCTGGPPFVFDSAGTGNCSIEQIGSLPGLLCDVPTTITFVHHGHQWVADASLCQ